MAEWRQRQRARGLVPVEVWVPAERSAEIAALARSWCPAPSPTSIVIEVAPPVTIAPAIVKPAPPPEPAKLREGVKLAFPDKPPPPLREMLKANGWVYTGQGHEWALHGRPDGIHRDLVADATTLCRATLERITWTD